MFVNRPASVTHWLAALRPALESGDSPHLHFSYIYGKILIQRQSLAFTSDKGCADIE